MELKKIVDNYNVQSANASEGIARIEKLKRDFAVLREEFEKLRAERLGLDTPQMRKLISDRIIDPIPLNRKIASTYNKIIDLYDGIKDLSRAVEFSESAMGRSLGEYDALVDKIKKSCPPPQAAPSSGGGRFVPYWSTASSQTHFGVFLGGAMVTGLPTTSSSGFFDGNLDHGAASLGVGGSAFVDLATFGTSPGAFGTYTLSGGVVVDYFGGTSLQYHGECGGFACMGTGHLSELNAIAELKLTTPIAPGYTINGYLGVGSATMWPTGQPTGAGGPNFLGSATAAAFRVGCGFDERLDPNWSAGFKVGFQHTGSTEYDTTLPGERFRIDAKNEVIFGATLTWTPSGGP